MSTITLELPEDVAAAVLATPGGLARVQAMIEAAFASGKHPAVPGVDPLAALWNAIPVKGPAPEDLSREAIYADHD